MAIETCEILQVAEILADVGGEAAHRSAASRAYYAAFLTVRDTLPEEFTPDTSGRSSHDAVVSSLLRFSRSTDKGRTEAVQIVEALPRLKRKRRRADYELQSTFSHNEAMDAIAKAKRIIGQCCEIDRKLVQSQSVNQE